MKLIAAALMFVALTVNARPFANALEEAMAKQITCFVNSEVERVRNLLVWQTARIAELERQLAERK